MNECKTVEVQSSPGSFIKALQSLHCKLIQTADSSTDSSSATTQQDFLRTIADELIELERAIFHIDEEVNGVHSSCIFDYEDNCEWYNDVLEKLALYAKGEECNACEDSDGKHGVIKRVIEVNINDQERCIDRCLDACGYTRSLDAAVECLRSIVHHNSSTVLNSAPFQEERNNHGLGIIAAITSLRTVRRRLLLLPTSLSEEEGLNLTTSFPKPYREAISRLNDKLDDQQMRHIQCMILPLAFHQNQRTYQYSKTYDQYEMSDSLSSLARSVLPTLISAACHALNLPLPNWATPKYSYRIMFHYAWKCLLAGDLIRRSCPTNPSTQDCAIIASNYFHSTVKQMIVSGCSNVVAHQVYKCWKSFGNDPSPSHHCELVTPRSIFCLQLQSTICSISSKHSVAIFCRAIIHDSAKMVILKSTSYDRVKLQARDQLDEICRANIMPFLREVMLPSLVKDETLADTLVQFIILSPPASYHSDTRSSQSYPTLQAIDRVVPRCLAQLLALTRDCELNSPKETESFQNVNDTQESDDDSINSVTKIFGFLSNIHTAASIWCEDVFVTRTDTLKQQYVTEFLLQPLKCNEITKFDLKQSVFNDDTTLAAVLVQGVSLRLDVSRSESIRMDGMLVAEAMAAVLGQELKFDELHPPSCDDDGGISFTKATELLKPEKRLKKRNRTKRVLEPRTPVVVDPDALLLFNSDSSSCSSQQNSSTNSCDSSDDSSDSASSWGEDSLQPYALDDDEEDISRVPRPRTLRECLAYLTSSDDDAMAYDKQQAALSELTTIITAQPLDLHDVISMLVRIMLHLEDKFGMDQFDEKRWNSLMALGTSAPTETCLLLVGEMRGNISLCTRLDALSLLKGIAQDLSGTRRNSPHQLMNSDQEISRCSTKLRLARNENETADDGDDATSELPMQLAKTRRWRKERTRTTSTPNRFGAVAVQMIYSLLSFLSQTRTDEVIWGGAIGEQFLSEFLKTLCTMIYCANTYPSSSLLILAADLFDLAWIFHDAKCSEVRHSSLLAMFTSISLLPLESVMQRAHGIGLFLRHCSERDESADCRHIASLILGSISEMMNENLIGGY